MNITLISGALLLISLLTNATVQGIKELFPNMKFSKTALASVCSVILTLAISIGYILYTGTHLSTQIYVIIVSLMYLSFLVSTNGYDAIMKIIDQFKTLGGTK